LTKDFFPYKYDVPPNYWRVPNVGPKTKQWKNESVGACFLICSTSKVGRRVGALGSD
jgi:hypothetical protein